MKRPWFYLINPFLTATSESYRKMKQIGDFTHAALAAAVETTTDPEAKAFFQTLLDMINKPADDYDHAYVTWLQLQGAQKGQTRSLADVLEDLRGNQAEAWDIAIQGVYRQSTPQYMALMPRRRISFQQGSQQDRISAVGALSIALNDDPKLSALNDKVDAFYDELVTANNAQKGSKSTKSGSSAELEADRVKLAIVLYGILGLLMNHFKETPEAIAPYFLIRVLRDAEQTEWERELKGGEQRLLFTRTFGDDDQIAIENTGHTGLLFALVATKDAPMPADAIMLKAGENTTVSPNKLGAAGNRFFIVKNISDTEKGDCRVVIE